MENNTENRAQSVFDEINENENNSINSNKDKKSLLLMVFLYPVFLIKRIGLIYLFSAFALSALIYVFFMPKIDFKKIMLDITMGNIKNNSDIKKIGLLLIPVIGLSIYYLITLIF